MLRSPLRPLRRRDLRAAERDGGSLKSAVQIGPAKFVYT